MCSDLASAVPSHSPHLSPQIRTLAAIVAAGFRRHATYRQAMIAAVFTNSVFGVLRYSVLTATARGAGGSAAGYTAEQLSTYCWMAQGILGVVLLWGWTELGDRIRSGDVVADLLRPVHPVASYLAVDLGRAGVALLTRFTVPILIGALFFHLYLPRRVTTYPLVALSLALAVVVCFGCRYLVNATAFWLLDMRGIGLLWTFASGVFTGLSFPLAFLPGWLAAMLFYATPFPSILQATVNIAVERGGPAEQVGTVAVQAGWAVVLLGLCGYVQRRAEHRLVIQGG